MAPMIGSPGVGQNPLPKERTFSSIGVEGRLLKLTTLVGSGADSFVNLMRNVNQGLCLADQGWPVIITIPV